MKDPEARAPYLPHMAIHTEFIKEVAFAEIGDSEVSNDNPGLPVSQIVFSNMKIVKQMNACLVGDTDDRIVAQMGCVVEVAHLNLNVIVKLVFWLFFEFNSRHAEVLQ